MQNLPTLGFALCRLAAGRLTMRCLQINTICTSGKLNAAPPKKSGAVSATARTGIAVETDATRLTQYCCGLNIYKDGTDPELKPDEEYPEWLWTLDREPHTRSVNDLDKDTFKYWKKIRKEHIKRQNIAARLRYK